MEHAGLAPKGEVLKPLTFRERKFVDAYFRTTPIFNGAEAARAIGCSEKSCRVQAVRLLTKDNVMAEIQARQVEYQQETQITRAEWLRKVRRLYDADVRKLFDAHNNPIDIPLLGDNEALLIEGFEVVEDFTKVKDNRGREQAVCTGYTKKIRHAKPKDVLAFVGKALGYMTDEPPEPEDQALKSLQIVFVNSKGERVDVNLNPSRAPLTTPPPPEPDRPIGVKFVKSVDDVAGSDRLRNY